MLRDRRSPGRRPVGVSIVLSIGLAALAVAITFVGPIDEAGAAPDRLVVVGGPTAVSSSTAAEIGRISGGVTVERRAGATRYETAVAMSQLAFPNGTSTVFVASGIGFADALAATSALAAFDAALLLTAPGGLSNAMVEELQRLDPSQVYVIGGTSAVSETVRGQITAAVGLTARRIDGPNRYATAVAVSRLAAPDGARTVYLASGAGFADALAASNALVGGDAVLLLTAPDLLPAEVAGEISRLSPSQVFVVGGTAAVSTAVAEQVRSTTGIGPVRLAGANRYATAAEVMRHARGGTVAEVYVASGTGFADALATAQTVIQRDGTLVLTAADALPAESAVELARLAGAPAPVPSTTSTTTAPPPPPAARPLDSLTVAAEYPTGYDRDLFRHWISSGRPNCDTRDEVLIAESLDPVTIGSRCAVSGRWYSVYDGVETRDPSTFDIDHMVPLKEAWDSGAHAWTAAQREAFANDLQLAAALIAVTASSNRSKSDRDPAEWMPPRTAYHCTYVNDWIAVKVKWRLSVDPAEYAALDRMLASC